MFEDVMIDLETLGNGPDAVVVSIGAVFFNPYTGAQGPTFYQVLDIQSQVDVGRVMNPDTVKWWMSQKDAAKRVFHEKANLPGAVLLLLSNWIGQFRKTPKEKVYVWGNGSSFDVTISEQLYKSFKIPCPWGYNCAMDMRTIKRFMGKGKDYRVVGTAHNALDDAIAQAKFVSECVGGFNVSEQKVETTIV